MAIMLKNTRIGYLIMQKNADNATKNAEPVINLDVNNPNFRAGVMVQANFQSQLMVVTWQCFRQFAFWSRSPDTGCSC